LERGGPGGLSGPPDSPYSLFMTGEPGAGGMAAQEVRRRCVFFLGGYEPIPPVRQHERFVRELARFQQVWQVASEVSAPALSADGTVTSWRVETRGPNWAVETEYRSLLWGDFVVSDFKRSNWERVPSAIAAFADFIGTGTAWRYFTVSWRYGLFFLYPVLLLILFAGIAAALAWQAMAHGLAGQFAAVLALGVFALLNVWPGRLLMLQYMLDDWLFAQELVRHARPGLDARLESFARDIAERLRAGGVDEIVFSGHSLGCALQADVLDRALRMVAADADGKAPAISVLSTGSSLLKIALHPAGRWLKDAVARISRNEAVVWVEYQALVDIISFYKSNPLVALRLPDTGRPTVRKVYVRNMLRPETYRRFRGNFFRLHRQLVMGNDRRYFYDYFMICCGPFRLQTRLDHPDRVMAFGADGSLQEADPANAAAAR